MLIDFNPAYIRPDTADLALPLLRDALAELASWPPAIIDRDGEWECIARLVYAEFRQRGHHPLALQAAIDLLDACQRVSGPDTLTRLHEMRPLNPREPEGLWVLRRSRFHWEALDWLDDAIRLGERRMRYNAPQSDPDQEATE